MPRIISQILRQITTQNPIPKGIWNDERSQLIVSIRGDLEEIRDQFIKLSSDPFDLLEICPTSLDVLPFKKKIKKPWILTYKKSPFQPQEEYLQDLHKLVTLNPDYLDIDHEDFDFVSKNLPYQGKWIISYHDFSPASSSGEFLSTLYNELSLKQATLVKIALSPTSPANALALFFRARQIQEKEQKLLFVCMGEKYSWTRILASKWNIGAAYCCIEGYGRYGQLSNKELIETYSFYKHHLKTRVYALLGNPVEQSLSHITHNQIFRDREINALYCKIPVTAEEVAPFLELAKTRFSGFSITRPLKGAVVPNEIINTIYADHFHFGYANTDATSALSLIKERGVSPHESILILGTGGTAKAIATSLFRSGWENITLLSRTSNMKLEGIDITDYDTWACLPHQKVGLVINTTPLGSVFSEKVQKKFFKSSPLFFEVNYNPALTPLVQKALEKECEIIWGMELFALQAAMQMAFWFHFNQEEQESIRGRILEMCASLLQIDKKLIAKVEKLPR